MRRVHRQRRPAAGTSRPSRSARRRCPGRSSGPGRSGRGGARGPTAIVARPTALTVPSTTSRSNHQQAVGDLAADDDEQQVVEVVEPPLVERRAVEERDPGAQLADALGAGGRSVRPAMSTPNSRQAIAMPTTATVTLARISTPSMPNRANGASSSAERLDRPLEDRREPVRRSGWRRTAARGTCRGRPTGSPAGSAGRSSPRGDSWILSQTALGPRNAPQKVRPMSRNM